MRYVHAMTGMWQSEDSSQDWVLTLHWVGPGNEAQDTRFGGKCLYSLNHFVSSFLIEFFKIMTLLRNLDLVPLRDISSFVLITLYVLECYLCIKDGYYI